MTSGFNRITPHPLFFARGPPRSLVGGGVPQRVLYQGTREHGGAHVRQLFIRSMQGNGAERRVDEFPRIFLLLLGSLLSIVSVIALGVCSFASAGRSLVTFVCTFCFRIHELPVSVSVAESFSVPLRSSVRLGCRVSVHFGVPGLPPQTVHRNSSPQPRLMQLLRTDLGDARLTCWLGPSSLQLSSCRRRGCRAPRSTISRAQLRPSKAHAYNDDKLRF